MKVEHKEIIKKALTENLPKPSFGNTPFVGCIAGWERQLNNDEFRRFTLKRDENNGDVSYILEARNLLVGNVKKPIFQDNPYIKITIKNLSTLNDPVLDDWLSVHHCTESAKQGIIKIIAEDLIKAEKDRLWNEFLKTL